MKDGRLLTTISVLAVMVCVALAVPAAAATMVRVEIPFAFDAAEIAMPAGQYVIERSLGAGMLYLTNEKGEKRVVMTVPVGNPNQPHNPRLVFEKYGATYRLAEVHMAGMHAGAGIPATKNQMLVAKRQWPERVVVALVR
ncbi:MAG: hypothetical protein HY858_14620 [Candidatus Solibacter usitatus]|nr:hypothetical protein [Candidatus Solibacter usitatus]